MAHLVREEEFHTPRLRMHALVAGNPEAKPVVLLHGFPELSESWRDVLPALADAGFRAVAPDLRGYGRTDKPETGYRVEELSSDIAALVEALGGRAHVVGHDWGGIVAYHLAARHPSRVHALSVVNCPHPGALGTGKFWRPEQLRRSWYIFFFQLPWLPERLLTRDGGSVIPRFLRGAAVNKARFTRERLGAYTQAFADRHDLRGPIEYYRQAFRTFFHPRRRQELVGLPQIVAPFLLVWGEKDVALGKHLSEDMEAYFTQPIRRAYLPDVGHFVPMEAPEQLAPLLVDHFRACS